MKIARSSLPPGNASIEKCRTAVVFDNIGPYHRARLEAAAGACDLLAIELGKTSSEYCWPADEKQSFRRVTINPLGESRALGSSLLREQLRQALGGFKADVVFLPGWSCRGSIFAMEWCVQNRKRAVIMSESTFRDTRRRPLRELAKRRFVRLAAAGFAGGTPQREYLIKLGIEPERVATGYDAVDNGHFETGAASIRSAETENGRLDQISEARRQHQLPRRYFLASARFIKKKNLSRLIAAYARYRSLARGSGETTGQEIWDLVLLGDGPLRAALRSQVAALGLQGCVQLPGFQSYERLPVFYGLAEAFVHASATEQWGLVVNEALASGLPVIVSNRCGCVFDLVWNGSNGFVFDPYDVEQLARLMLRVAKMDRGERDRMGDVSRKIVADWGPDRFARGLKEAIGCAMGVAPVRASLLDRLLLRLLVLRESHESLGVGHIRSA